MRSMTPRGASDSFTSAPEICSATHGCRHIYEYMTKSSMVAPTGHNCLGVRPPTPPRTQAQRAMRQVRWSDMLTFMVFQGRSHARHT